MQQGGSKVAWRKLNDQEYADELVKKLEEELDELAAGFGKDRARDLEELADVAEVYEAAWDVVDREEHYDLFADAMDELDKGIELWEVDPDELLAEKAKKAEKVGGFVGRIYIEAVTVADDDPWLQYYLKSPEKYPEV